MLDHIITSLKGQKFYLLINAENKVWYIPKRRMKLALQLYQPTSIIGVAVKNFLPYLKYFPFLLSKIGINGNHFILSSILEDRLKNCFGVGHIDFSAFLGTPSVNQKITLQISTDDKLLGYCKISSAQHIKKLFKHEEKILHSLISLGVSHLPHCLYCGPIDKETWIFVQSTTKTSKSKIIHKWKDDHHRFITNLIHKTKKEYFFDETDFAKSLITLEHYLKDLPLGESQVIERAIFKVRNHFGDGLVSFSAFHADFTPWNIYFEGGELFAFDLEYAGMSYPPYLDFFHFINQVAIIEKDYPFEEVYTFCQTLALEKIKLDDFAITYLCYLLNIVSFYFDINKNVLDISDRCYKRWFPLINLIVKDLE